jgi:hypothetical protein
MGKPMTPERLARLEKRAKKLRARLDRSIARSQKLRDRLGKIEAKLRQGAEVSPN